MHFIREQLTWQYVPLNQLGSDLDDYECQDNASIHVQQFRRF